MNESARLNFQPIVDELRSRGYVEGQNIAFEARYPTGQAQLQQAAADLVRLKVDLIVTNCENAALAAKQATSRVPVVITGGFDPNSRQQTYDGLE